MRSESKWLAEPPPMSFTQVADRLRGWGQATLFGLCLSGLLKLELHESIDFREVRLFSSCHS